MVRKLAFISVLWVSVFALGCHASTVTGTSNPGTGSLVSSGSGNIVAQGGGNIIGENSSGIVAAGGGNLTATQAEAGPAPRAAILKPSATPSKSATPAVSVPATAAATAAAKPTT